MARIIASDVSSFLTRPSTRWEMKGSTMAISPRSARSLTASAHAFSVATVRPVLGIDADQHLAAVPPEPLDALRRRTR